MAETTPLMLVKQRWKAGKGPSGYSLHKSVEDRDEFIPVFQKEHPELHLFGEPDVEILYFSKTDMMLRKLLNTDEFRTGHYLGGLKAI